MTKVNGSFELASWDEDTYEEMDDGAKLTRASVTQTFSGDVTGDGAAQWLMAYRPDGTAHFVGLQRITGTVIDRKGAVVLETIGDFDGKVATWTATVVPGSGSGDLQGLTGAGKFEAPMGSKASFELDFD
jgi:hypothetical protein